MIKCNTVKLFTTISSICINIIRKDYERGRLVLKGPLICSNINTKFYTEGPGKQPPKEEQIDAIKMPGFVHPQTMHDEGYFTQKAKQQLEELKKRLDKPTIENTEKKE